MRVNCEALSEEKAADGYKNHVPFTVVLLLGSGKPGPVRSSFCLSLSTAPYAKTVTSFAGMAFVVDTLLHCFTIWRTIKTFTCASFCRGLLDCTGANCFVVEVKQSDATFPALNTIQSYTCCLYCNIVLMKTYYVLCWLFIICSWKNEVESRHCNLIFRR